jgi:hypothetical protein
MWKIKKPDPVKLIMGILAADQECLQLACEAVIDEFGVTDMISEVYPFTQTSYYKDEAGENILRQFLSFEKLIDPGKLATIKIKSNKLEEKLAKIAHADLPRPINLDPGIIEPSKLILASTKNFSHRIYIGDNMYAELTLSYCKGVWNSFSYTFPDFKEDRYHKFLSGVRERLVEQLREIRKKD